MQLSGVSAVVTGGASGLGEAMVRALSAEGVAVAIFDVSREKGEALSAEVGGMFCEVDITNSASVEAGFAKARASQGQERILVSCAGRGNTFKTVTRSRETGQISQFPIDAFEKIVQINLIGTFRCITNAAAGMLSLEPLEDGERGVIITTASIAAEDGQPGQAAYASSKAGIVGLTLPVARDLMGSGIRVNSILPGIFDTPLFATAKPELRAALEASVPFPRRMGRASEFASLALEICRNAYINGEHIRLDGALRLGPR